MKKRFSVAGYIEWKELKVSQVRRLKELEARKSTVRNQFSPGVLKLSAAAIVPCSTSIFNECMREKS